MRNGLIFCGAWCIRLNKPLFITQPRVGIYHPEILALQIAAREMDWDVYPAPTSWRLTEEMIASKVSGVPYGSQTFGEVISQQMNWKLKQNTFDWLARVPNKYLKRQVDFMSLGDAKKITTRKFIKPADDKCFDAKVYDPGEFNPADCIADDYPVLVSDEVEWEFEYRCFINGCVKTWSNYLFNGEINSEEFAHTTPSDLEPLVDFTNRVLDEMPDTVPSVVDVGIIKGKGWAVLETNQCWASGIYHCDPEQVLKVLQASCELI